MHELDITLDRCAWNHSRAANEILAPVLQPAVMHEPATAQTA